MHQYARYFERYRGMAQNRPLSELAPEDVIASFRRDIERESGKKQNNEAQMEQELRTRIDNYHLELFQHTQTETTKRWTYEQEVKRPYYHVTELDESQLANWRKYLDFEESEGDYTRTKFLYERCLVTAANYDEFWFRYARWMLAQGKQEEVRSIYQRASCVFVPIARPDIRLYYAQYEESRDCAHIAADIYEAVLMHLPNHLETIMSLVNLHRRQHGVDTAIQTLKKHIHSPDTASSTRGALISEWARIVWEINGQADEARNIYQSNRQTYLDCRPFWLNWFFFEVKQPASGPKQQTEHYERVKAVYQAICSTSRLPRQTVSDVTSYYLVYLKERGGKETMEEFMRVDQEVNGPYSVQKGLKDRVSDDAEAMSMDGYPGAEVHESITRQGGEYLKSFVPQGAEVPVQPANGQAVPAVVGRY